MRSDTAAKVVLYWHRTDLRLHDSPALCAALDLNPSIFIPVWTWDPHYVHHTRVGPNRMKFLLESQADLSKSYAKLNPRQKLLVVREGPQTVLPKLWKLWGVTHLAFEKDTDPYARERDERIMAMAEDAGVKVVIRMGRNLFDPDELVAKNGGEPTMSFSQVQKASEKIQNGEPDKPFAAPETIPDPWDETRLGLVSSTHDHADAELDLQSPNRTKIETQFAQTTGQENLFSVPTLEEIGIEPAQATTPHQGGESTALRILNECLRDSAYIGQFEKPKTSPAAFAPQSTMLLSPYLHFGSISVRRIWWDVQSILKDRMRQKKPNTSMPTNIPGQLLFRDMYFAAHAAIGYQFAHTRGNKIARFIDWHLPSDISPCPDGKWVVNRTYCQDSDQAEAWFQRWKNGVTGFHWIDALMRQLRQEGWIHHLGRHSVACFLTRGGCYVDWERGAEVFEELLIDHEAAANLGNWMWLSCTAFFSQYYRCYSPISFGKKWDPDGLFIRRYCPQLSRFDKKYIFEPWKAPISDQKRWGCRVVGDGINQERTEEGISVYPKPMFDFDERRQVCLNSMRCAYDAGIYGDDPQLRDSSWKGGFASSERPQKRHKRARDL